MRNSNEREARGRLVLSALLLLLLLLAPARTAALAQGAGTNGAEAAPEVTAGDRTVEALQAHIKQIEESGHLEDATEKGLLETYQEALAHARLREKYTALIAQFGKETEEAPSQLAAVKSELADSATEPGAGIPADASLAQTEQLLAQAEADLAQARQKTTDLEAEQKRRADRRAEIPGLVAAARDRLADVTTELAAKPTPEEADPMAVAGRLLLEVRKGAAEKEIRSHEEELRSYDARRELLAARRDQAARRVAQAEKLVRARQEIVNERRRTEAEQAAQEAQRMRREAARAHPVLRELAEANATLAERRSGPEGLASRTGEVSTRLAAVDEQKAAVMADFSNVQEKIKAGRLTKAVGLLLLRKRGDLPDCREHQRDIRRMQSEISEAQFELMELEEQRSGLANMDRALEAVVRRLAPPVAASERDDIEAEAEELLLRRREYLDALIGDYDTYFSKLVDLDESERQLVATAEEYARYIDERILWVQSASPLHVNAFAPTWAALRWLASPGGWAAVLRSLWADLRAVPALYALAVLVLLALLHGGRRARRRLKRTSGLLHKVETDRLSYSVEAFLLALLIAAFRPAGPAFLAWRLGSQLEGAEFTGAVAAGLRAAAAWYYALAVIRALCLPAGLAGAHFRMLPEGLKSVRWGLRWFTMVIVATAFLGAALEWQANDLWQEALGRLVSIAGLIALAVLLFVLLRPRGHLMKGVVDRNRGGWLDRSRYVWYPAAVAVPVVLAVIAALGYYYTARQLEHRFYLTIALVLAAVLVNALLVRWLSVVRRRLATQDAKARKAAARGEQETAEESVGAPVTVDPEPEESLYVLSVRTRRFLRVLLASALLVGLWAVWADVLPALGILKRVELWSTTVKVVETAGAEAGETVQMVERVVPITLAGVLLSVAVLAVAIIAARNVPGLLEIAILRHLPMDRGVRFAVTSLSRYLMIGVGVVMAFGKIGIGWSKVQWLIAAMTVGLGFGLQEIFANFVSGLIILFERPMRVGDTVTVGETTGTVTRIRIRATTILDWNRKELVVPNKEFITGRLINWTLSDTILRMDFPVGIAYGSDTGLAEELLLSVARDNQLVLEEPAPTVVFRGFGDSSLTFELRVFIPNMDSYLTVWHQVNRGIDDAFRKGGVEIAFPQRDIHVRSVRGPFPIEMKPEKGSKTDEGAHPVTGD